MDWKTINFKANRTKFWEEEIIHPKELSEVKTMHSTKKRSMPIRTSDQIRTMCNARSTWSLTKSLGGCSRAKDEIRLKRNESALKRRRLRIENTALRRKIRQLENLVEMGGK